MTLTIPPKLRHNDTIGLVSPSAGLAPLAMHRIKRAVDLFEKLGYFVRIGENALKNNGYVSASAEERAEDINEMFRDPEVKLIMATIGGNHSNQILKYLDFGLIKKNPKIFMGYSDNTVLHYAFQAKSSLATYYGPCAMTQFGENPRILDYTLQYFKCAVSQEEGKKAYTVLPSDTWTEEFLDWLKKEDELRPRKLEKNSGYEWLRQGQAQGELLGGAIPSVNHLAGTPYWLNPQDKIFFLDIPEGYQPWEGSPLEEIDSYLADLDNMGLFDSIRGLIIGRPFHYSPEQTLEFKKIISKYTNQNKCPILFNVNMGHTDPIITVRLGSVVKLDSTTDSFRILS